MARRQKTVRTPVVMPEETPHAAWLRGIRFSGFTLMVLLLIVAALVVLAPSLKIYVQQREQIAALQESVNQQKSSVATLKSDVARWNDPVYVAAQARDRLYYAYPGEITYIVIGGGAKTDAQDGVPISDKVQSTTVDWTRTLLASIYSAGLTSQTPSKLPAPDVTGR